MTRTKAVYRAAFSRRIVGFLPWSWLTWLSEAQVRQRAWDEVMRPDGLVACMG